MRQLLFGELAGGLLPVTVEVVILALQAAIFIWLAAFSLDRMEQRGRREGRLTLRWQ